MCRSIKPLFNFDPSATDEEIKNASLQFVRKVSGFKEPSKINEEVFDNTVKEISRVTRELLDNLKTSSEPKNREIEAKKAKERVRKRFS